MPNLQGLTVLLLLTALPACQPSASEAENPEQAILALERRALDQWSQGNPMGYTEFFAEDVTYLDDIGAQSRLAGRDAVGSYFRSLEGKVPPHRYELVDPKVQVYGDVAILTLRYKPTMGDGKPAQEWKATSVYHQSNGDWRVVHANWSKVES